MKNWIIVCVLLSCCLGGVSYGVRSKKQQKMEDYKSCVLDRGCLDGAHAACIKGNVPIGDDDTPHVLSRECKRYLERHDEAGVWPRAKACEIECAQEAEEASGLGDSDT